MTRRRALFAASCVLTLAAAWLVARCSADSIADVMARRAHTARDAIRWLLAPPNDSSPRVVLPVAHGDAAPVPAAPSASNIEPSRARLPTAKPAARRGILIRRSVVEDAVRRGVRPTTTFVSATDDHPAGLVVHGWQAASSALRDGDIIVSIGGRAPATLDDVIAAVSSAYRRQVFAVSGRVWRDGETIDVSVELPYPNNQRQTPTQSNAAPPRNAHRIPKSTGGP